MSVCELKWCITGWRRRATVRVNENIGDQSYAIRICQKCASALGLKNGDDLPDANTTKRVLKGAKP